MDVSATMATVANVNLDTGEVVVMRVVLRTVMIHVTKAAVPVWNVRKDIGEISVTIIAVLRVKMHVKTTMGTV